uniref:Uncharacterized protein n=1 Tax=Opuntia streptacantha TaxID=393608 RepID=A0A7C9E8J9_OPUST
MHWFQLADEVSICECRCTRARLPPSKYWLFEPRCSMHDIGGWYIETYGRDKKSKIVPSQRYWDDNNAYQQFEKTLDMENAGRPKRTIWEVAQGNLSKMFSWCKKLV